MTLQDFTMLNEIDQLTAILEHGKLMAQNVEDDSRLFLYRIESFYVLANYSATTDQLNDITCFLEVDQAIPHFRKQIISINPAERQYETPES